MTRNRITSKRSCRRIDIQAVALAIGLIFGFAGVASSQSPRPLNTTPNYRRSQQMPSTMGHDIGSRHDIIQYQDRRTRDFSWMHIDQPRARRILVHDIISIVVDEKSQVTLRDGFDRQRNGNLKAELKEFMRIGKKGNLATAAANQPTIDTNLTSRMNSTARATTQEGISYRIAATVVDVLPNGTIVLEARKSIRTDRDVWQFSLTGLIRSEDVRRDNTALSENIANLDIVKTRDGKVYDSTKRPWGIRLYDWLSPF